MTSEKKSKASHVFPAPEWTSLSASLAASLAHEIRNPLLAIKGAAQLLEQVVGPDDRTLTQLIITESTRIEQLVATMDPLTPNPTQVKEALNIHEITEYVRLAASTNARKVQFITHYDPSLPPVRGVREHSEANWATQLGVFYGAWCVVWLLSGAAGAVFFWR